MFFLVEKKSFFYLLFSFLKVYSNILHLHLHPNPNPNPNPMLLSLNMLVAGAGAALLCSWRVRGAGFTESLEITHSPSSPSSPSSHLVYFNYTFTHHSPALMELLQLHYPSISHLHLTFTTGRQPLLKQGNGVQLLVIHHDDNANGEEYQHLNWKRLVHDLSGIFCASLNLLDTTVTASPIWSLQHNVNNGGGGGSNSSSSKARYAVLPKESQCTENLTPWIKMLPCRNKAGLAALLDPYHIYNSNFVEMGIQYTKTCGVSDDEGQLGRSHPKALIASFFNSPLTAHIYLHSHWNMSWIQFAWEVKEVKAGA